MPAPDNGRTQERLRDAELLIAVARTHIEAIQEDVADIKATIRSVWRNQWWILGALFVGALAFIANLLVLVARG